MVIAVVRHRHRDPDHFDLDERGGRWILWGGTVMPVVVLGAVSTFAVVTLRAHPRARATDTIRVTGHQWWWQLDYELSGTRGSFRAANELHMPVGRPVRLLLTAGDVIHSFWVPRLQGKMDLIPGDTNTLELEASRAGRFGGACAEYCGTQHARMSLTVVAEDSATFEAWAQAQRADGTRPADSVALAGQQLFLAGPCATCHTVRGTMARGEVGPDLTHIGSRLTIAAGALPNSLGNIAGWIANPQALKPGAAMPTLSAYDGTELRALATYVASLK
jgi:cytochrome c oxidase subunit 2